MGKKQKRGVSRSTGPVRAKRDPAVSFSTTLSLQAKEALLVFCRRRGLRINHFLEEVIWDRLEDEMDAEIANADEGGELVDLEDLRDTAA